MPMNKKNYQLEISLKEFTWNGVKDVFSKSYKIAMRKEFVDNTNLKDHWFENHVMWFLTQLKTNCKPLVTQPFEKRQIYTINFGMNIGSEINGFRPSLIYKASHNTLWEDVLAIPLTSALREKQSDKFDVFIPKNEKNNLYQNSYARLRQLRSVSVKRIGKIVGTITDNTVINAINDGVKAMLAVDL